MTAPTPRMALPDKVRARRFNDQAVTVAAILKASGHEPDVIVFRTLRTIHTRCPNLSFTDFVAGCALALTMVEASERGHS
jgi:hypothetical protein